MDQLIKEVTIPEGVSVSFEGNKLSIKGPKGELVRQFSSPYVKIELHNNKILIIAESKRRKVKALVGTWIAHIKNMIVGVTKGWMISLKAIYSHFPIRLTIEKENVLIHNFLGERKPRIAKILGDVKVDIKGPDITITGINKEYVGQTAANIEKATHITGRDRRIFSDGVWITTKCVPIE
jgi:large subunit ribosomal protein L6